MVKFGVSGKSEGPGPMDFMVLMTFRFIQTPWTAAIVKVFLEFAKKGLLAKTSTPAAPDHSSLAGNPKTTS